MTVPSERKNVIFQANYLSTVLFRDAQGAHKIPIGNVSDFTSNSLKCLPSFDKFSSACSCLSYHQLRRAHASSLRNSRGAAENINLSPLGETGLQDQEQEDHGGMKQNTGVACNTFRKEGTYSQNFFFFKNTKFPIIVLPHEQTVQKPSSSSILISSISQETKETLIIMNFHHLQDIRLTLMGPAQ